MRHWEHSDEATERAFESIIRRGNTASHPDCRATPKRRACRRKAAGNSRAEQDSRPKKGAPGQRRIASHQFTFLRAVVLGMPVRAAADRFLDPKMDLRKVQSELRWLRTELLAAARRAHAYGDARALQLDIARLPRYNFSLYSFPLYSVPG